MHRAAATTSSYAVDFRRSRPAPAPEAQSHGRIPRIAKLLSLAHKIDAMIRAGELRDLAHAAKLCSVTRARMTQIMNLTLLVPEIQEEILNLPPVAKGRDPITERHVRAIGAAPDWELQVRLWRRLHQGTG